MKLDVEVSTVPGIGQLVEAVERGDEVVVSREGKTVAHVVKASPGPGSVRPGSEDAARAIEEMEAIRARNVLSPGLTLRDLIDEGRR